MKTLTRYILKEHIPPFIFAFVTITFLLIIDYVPKIIDQVIDKDIGWQVVVELVALNLAWMLALSIPMAVLVSTLMAFGRLQSDFEITAIKASGVNLLRVLLPLLGAGAVIMVLMIEFNDKVLPDLNKKARLLAGDISSMRPTLLFRSGIFISDIPGYLVMCDKIDHETSRVQGVNITETTDSKMTRVIVAEYGFLRMVNGGRDMEFSLFNGELHSFETKNPINYRRVDFQNQIINISGTGSELKRSDSDYRTDREMGIGEMQLKVEDAQRTIDPFRSRILSGIDEDLAVLFAGESLTKDSIHVNDSVAYSRVKSSALGLKLMVQRNVGQIAAQRRIANKYLTEVYKKYSIPSASLAFILIGAPLAMLARRGGMGISAAIAILLFIIYWAFLIGGEDLADRGIVHPFIAMWSANILMAIVGIYLIYIAVTERRILGFLRAESKR
jgi:lipopolysaccharide export system permease protein